MITKWRNTQKRKVEILPLLTNLEFVFTVWDVETTGLESTDKLTQFSAAKYRFDGNMFHELSFYNTYLNPEQPLTADVIAKTGITDDMLKDAPKEQEVVDDILNYLGDCDVWIGYNINFDIGMVANMAQRTQRVMPTKPAIDVMELARDFLSTDIIKNHKLESVTEYLVPGTFQFHNSMDDVRATIGVFESLLPELQAYSEEMGEGYVHLEKAGIWQNPYKKEARIKLMLSEGKFGDIYYNVYEHYWACKSDTASKKLFNRINLMDLEAQFIDKYCNKFGCRTIEDVGFSWLKFRREQEREKKKQKIS